MTRIWIDGHLYIITNAELRTSAVCDLVLLTLAVWWGVRRHRRNKSVREAPLGKFGAKR